MYRNTLEWEHTGTGTHWNLNTLEPAHTGTGTHWNRYTLEPNMLEPVHTGTGSLERVYTGTRTHWYRNWYCNLKCPLFPILHMEHLEWLTTVLKKKQKHLDNK